MNTGKYYGYIRVSKDTQDYDNQRLAILDYARLYKIHIADFIAVEISSRKSFQARKIDELIALPVPGDTIISTEISRLGRSTIEDLTIINELHKKQVGFIAIKEGVKIPANGDKMDLATKVQVTMFSLCTEIEREHISSRTKMGLVARKAAGITLGKPKGTIQSSKLDEKREVIEELLKHRVAKSAIARMVGTSRTNLLAYLETRKIPYPKRGQGGSP